MEEHTLLVVNFAIHYEVAFGFVGWLFFVVVVVS